MSGKRIEKNLGQQPAPWSSKGEVILPKADVVIDEAGFSVEVDGFNAFLSQEKITQTVSQSEASETQRERRHSETTGLGVVASIQEGVFVAPTVALGKTAAGKLVPSGEIKPRVFYQGPGVVYNREQAIHPLAKLTPKEEEARESTRKNTRKVVSVARQVVENQALAEWYIGQGKKVKAIAHKAKAKTLQAEMHFVEGNITRDEARIDPNKLIPHVVAWEAVFELESRQAAGEKVTEREFDELINGLVEFWKAPARKVIKEESDGEEEKGSRFSLPVGINSAGLPIIKTEEHSQIEVPNWAKAATAVTFFSIATPLVLTACEQADVPTPLVDEDDTQSAAATEGVIEAYGTQEAVNSEINAFREVVGDLLAFNAVPFRITIEGDSFEFVAVPRQNSPNGEMLFDDQLFIKVDGEYGLLRKELTQIDGLDFVSWVFYADGEEQGEAVLIYPTEGEYWVGFTPPSALSNGIELEEEYIILNPVEDLPLGTTGGLLKPVRVDLKELAPEYASKIAEQVMSRDGALVGLDESNRPVVMYNPTPTPGAENGTVVSEVEEFMQIDGSWFKWQQADREWGWFEERGLEDVEVARVVRTSSGIAVALDADNNPLVKKVIGEQGEGEWVEATKIVEIDEQYLVWNSESLEYDAVEEPEGVAGILVWNDQLWGVDGADRTIKEYKNGEWLDVERKVGMVCKINEYPDCEFPEWVQEPLSESQIKRVYDGEGNPVEWGLIRSEKWIPEGDTFNIISGISRGAYHASGRKNLLRFEVPVKNGDSQYFYLPVSDGGWQQYNMHRLQDRNIEEYSYVTARDVDLVNLFENNIGEQVLLILLSDYPDDYWMSEYNDEYEEIFQGMENGRITHTTELSFVQNGAWFSREAWNRR